MTADVATGPAADEQPAARSRPALSPSRAADFKQCPLLYRLRVVDRLPEPPSPAAVRGTLVHAVLERLFDHPAMERTPDVAVESIAAEWERLLADGPELRSVVPEEDTAAWFRSVGDLLAQYYELEDPRQIAAAERELAVEVELDDGTPVRGIVDRLDREPDGSYTVIDYKTGRSPGPDHEAAALFQLKCYALLVSRQRGVLPSRLRLLYLGDGRRLQIEVDEEQLGRFERLLGALWRAVAAGLRTGDFPARRSGRCGWCSFQAYCPEFGGTTPIYPGPPEVNPEP